MDRECTKIRILRPTNENIFWGGALSQIAPKMKTNKYFLVRLDEQFLDGAVKRFFSGKNGSTPALGKLTRMPIFSS